MARKLWLNGKYKKRYVVVDDEDYDYLMSMGHWTPVMSVSKSRKYKWLGYVQRCQTTTRLYALMHRVVAERKYGYPCPPGYDVDHINNDPKDNRKCNLQYLTHGENVRKRFMLTPGYHKRMKSGWEVRRQQLNKITHKKELVFWRYCSTENEARLTANLLKKGYKIPPKRKER